MADHVVVVSDSGPLLQPGLDRLREQGVAVIVLAGGDSAAKVAAARAADAMLIGAEALTASEIEQIAAGGRLGLVIRCGVGFDVVDLAAATRHGIMVANVPDYCTDEVADHTFALLLAAVRRLPHFLTTWQDHGWDGSGDDLPVSRLADLTLGLIGAGRIGRAAATRARGFGMRVIATDPVHPPGIETLDLATLLAESDVVSIHCPLNSETFHLLNDRTLAAMRTGSILINTARGPIVDSAALRRGLERGQPAIAALDVVEGEPAPDLAQPLLAHPRVLITPHVAYYSVRAKRNVSVFAADNVLQFLAGQAPWHVVNLPTASR